MTIQLLPVNLLKNVVHLVNGGSICCPICNFSDMDFFYGQAINEEETIL